MGVTFKLVSNKNPATIQVRVVHGTADAKTTTKIKIDPKDFISGNIKTRSIPTRANADQKKQIEKINEANIEKRKKLEQIKLDLEIALSNIYDSEEICTGWIRDIIFQKTSSIVPSDLVGAFESYIDNRKDKNKSSTIKRLNTTLKRVKTFETENNSITKIYIKNVNPSLAIEMYNWWVDKKGNAPSTIYKTIKTIKTVCDFAGRYDVKTHPKLGNLTTDIANSRTKHTYLSLDEIKLLREAKIEDEKIDIARDWLIISCFTAFRVSDFFMVSTKNIVIREGFRFIRVKQQKTQQDVYLPLIDEIEQVLDKRDGSFPPLYCDNLESNKTLYNKWLKEACRIAGINEKVDSSVQWKNGKSDGTLIPKYKAISSHVGRRSFATNFYGKVNTALLIQATGHSSERQLINYIQVNPTIDNSKILFENLQNAVSSY